MPIQIQCFFPVSILVICLISRPIGPKWQCKTWVSQFNFACWLPTTVLTDVSENRAVRVAPLEELRAAVVAHKTVKWDERLSCVVRLGAWSNTNLKQLRTARCRVG